jgi:hypothetical protein
MRVTILHDVSASPDHIHTRLYKKGEQFEVDSPLMPSGLADILVKGGAFISKPIHNSGEALMSIPKQEVPAAKIDNKPLDPEWLEKQKQMHEDLFGKNAVVLSW